MTPVREYRWTFLNGKSTDNAPIPAASDGEAIKKLSDELTVSPLLAEILVRRGIDTFESARTFFRPTLDDLHDPFLMDTMRQAVDRIMRALDSKEKILIYGDYDVDGTNGTALLWTFLKSIHADVQYFIPDRIKDGYGLSNVGIERAKELGVTLLISVDCGITAISQVELARTLGIDVVICDHHEPGDPLPNAYAILDALKPSCHYPYKHLCGCSVGFKLIQALSQQESIRSILSESKENSLYSYLDFVTLATTADIVELKGENRTMVKLGLERINSNPRPGIRALIETSGLKPGRITAGQIVFVLAPRINAVGRLGNAMRAVELLTCDTYERALELAQVFEEENRNRRKIDEDTFLEAQSIVEQFLDVENEGAIILHQERWHPGVIGIVASRLVERYYRPTIMMTTVDGVAKGSARSVAGFDIYQALKRCEDTIKQFGGHKYAAGLSVEIDKLDEFKEAFNLVAKELLTEELLTPEIKIDSEIPLTELTPKFVRILSQFAPFGPGNMRPVFVARGVEVYGAPRIVGNNHLKFKIRTNGHVFDAIGFNLGNLISRVPAGRKDLSLAFSLDEGEFAGETFPQLKIRDLK
ncbi:MAG: single-stranded-DNA-specific exonuclease RecJ [Ignavibacteriales bacterium]|nr:single-stranded-DNA-specific exonuclease RecJ [Ignavibacteriales bacterium]